MVQHIEPSLTLMYQKLVELDFVCYDGKIEIAEPETEGGVITMTIADGKSFQVFA